MEEFLLEAQSQETGHWQNDNPNRKNYVQSQKSSTPLRAFVVDKGHKNGAEVHVVHDNATIYIFNRRTHRKITVLVARPGQIRRYWNKGWVPADIKPLLNLAFENQKQELNQLK